MLGQGKLLRPSEVASRLGISRSSVYRWFWEGKLKGVKLAGGPIRILESAVLEQVMDMDVIEGGISCKPQVESQFPQLSEKPFKKVSSSDSDLFWFVYRWLQGDLRQLYWKYLKANPFQLSEIDDLVKRVDKVRRNPYKLEEEKAKEINSILLEVDGSVRAMVLRNIPSIKKLYGIILNKEVS